MKVNKKVFILVVIVELFCLGCGIACFSIVHVGFSTGYAVSGEVKTMTLNSNGIFESPYNSENGAIYATISGTGAYMYEGEMNNYDYQLINEVNALTIVDTTAENQLKVKIVSNVMLVVALALVSLLACALILIILINYKKKGDEETEIETDDKETNEDNKGNCIDTDTCKEHKEEDLGTEVGTDDEGDLGPRINSLAEKKPTWQTIYKCAIDLEINSKLAKEDLRIEYCDHVENVAKTIQDGIIAHSDSIPIVEGKTEFNPIYHEQVNREGEPISGEVVLEVIEPGMIIDGYVVTKAKVKL